MISRLIERLRTCSTSPSHHEQRAYGGDDYSILINGVVYGPGSQRGCAAALSRLSPAVMHAEMAATRFLVDNRQMRQRLPLVDVAALQLPTDASGHVRGVKRTRP